jgi:hypothetical protein
MLAARFRLGGIDGDMRTLRSWRTFLGVSSERFVNLFVRADSIMTTAKTRRSGTTAGAREGRIPKPASRASEAIPVLIRLPRLVTEPDLGEACYAAEDEAEIRTTIPLQTRVPDPARSLPVPDDVHATTDSNGLGMPKGSAFLLHTMAPRTAPWLSFRFPRWAVRAAIAAGLIAVFVLAFSAIRGPTDNSDKVADFDSADAFPVPGIPALETSPVPMSLPPLSSTAPTAPTAVAPDAKTPASGEPVKDVPGIAKEADGVTETIPASSEIAQRQVNQNAPGTGESQAPLPASPETSASPTDAAPAEPAPAIPTPAGPPVTAELNAAETASAEANLPLIGQPAATEPVTPADLPSYPETNPTTFQYPPDYHLRLRSQTGSPARGIDEAGTGGPYFNGPTTNAAAANGWQPNTARLQPRIEPPPIR